MPEQESISISALIVNGEIAVQEVRLGKYLIYSGDKRQGGYSCSEYQYLKPPTLAEIMHAFHGIGGHIEPKAECGDAFSMDFIDTCYGEYRKNVLLSDGEGEWTSTFVDSRRKKRGEIVPDGYRAVRLINKPDKVFLDKKKGIWIAECNDPGRIFDALEPPEGWIVEYILHTGYPIRTSKNRADAQKNFGDDASQFYRSGKKLRGIFRKAHVYKESGPFCIYATSQPDARYSHIEARWSKKWKNDLEVPVEIIINPGNPKSVTPVYNNRKLSFELVPPQITDEWLQEFLSSIEVDYRNQ